MTDDGYHIVQTTQPVKGFYSPSLEYSRMASESSKLAKHRLATPDHHFACVVHVPVPPTPKELASNSWEYCYGADIQRPIINPDGPVSMMTTNALPCVRIVEVQALVEQEYG